MTIKEVTLLPKQTTLHNLLVYNTLFLRLFFTAKANDTLLLERAVAHYSAHLLTYNNFKQRQVLPGSVLSHMAIAHRSTSWFPKP